MKLDQFKNLVAFLALMENGGGLVDKSPEYIMEKYNRYIAVEKDEWRWGLDRVNSEKLTRYCREWKGYIKAIIK